MKNITKKIGQNFALIPFSIFLFFVSIVVFNLLTYNSLASSHKENPKKEFVKNKSDHLLIYNVNYPNFEKPLDISEQKELEAKLLEDKKNLITKYNDKDIPSDWVKYNNNWFGFHVFYPSNWKDPIRVKQQRGDLHEAKYSFRKNSVNNNEEFIGFDIIIYNKNRVDNLFMTNEVEEKEFNSRIKICPKPINLNQFEFNNYFKKSIVEFEANDPCYSKSFFLNSQKNNYIYNLVAVSKSNQNINEEEKLNNSTEYSKIASNFTLTKIVRPKPKPKAPIPHGAKKVNGKYVCGKKNDKPEKSDKNPPGHMDMQCCLDPDEVPNPWCSY